MIEPDFWEKNSFLEKSPKIHKMQGFLDFRKIYIIDDRFFGFKGGMSIILLFDILANNNCNIAPIFF